jgi:extracellular elastinolytic metalloproteinase
MVNEMAELMIAKHGFTPEIFMPLPNATKQEQDAFFLTENETPKTRASKRKVPRHGNTLTIQLLVDGMKLQPCRPGFHDIRDAIVQADENVSIA